MKKWLDNFGKADNANESNVSLTDNFNGLAYNTSYRDYSPAWGGQFQQGGTLPGTVGFTYARTGSIPSKGKYAKKTMASAQKGKQVQENVDSTLENILEVFDPTGISSWDDVYQSYQESGMSPQTKYEIFGALPILGKVGKAGKLINQMSKVGIKPHQKDAVNIIGKLLQSTPYVGRGTDVIQAAQQFSEAPFFPSAPPAGVGQFGMYAGIPSLKKKQNGGEMKFYQEGLDWKPKSMQDGGNMVINRELKNTPVVMPVQPQQQQVAPPEKSWMSKLGDFIGESKNFLAENVFDPVTTFGLDILNQIEPLDNQKIYNTVRPIDYPNVHKLPIHAYNYIMGNETEPLKTESGRPHISEEFWARAMGIPIEDGYLKESKHKPSISKNPDAKYYTIRDIIDQKKLMEFAKEMKAGEKKQVNGLGQFLDEYWYDENAKTSNGLSFDDLDPLQRFTLQMSDDGSYVSIYDKYDFDNPALNRMMKPIEIYDRFYTDKSKAKLLPNNPSKKKERGGIVKDDQGYWNPDNWGNPVEIGSNNITMQGVYEPLLGISDTGDTKLMKPGKDYKFKGSKVTEFPVAELGINQLDAQPMKKLNQLLNFTNNPDKTNWLDNLD